MKKYKVAILGATGMVGKEILKILEERNFPIEALKLTASKRTAGSKLIYKGKEIEVEVATPEVFKGIDIVLSSAGGSVSKALAPEIVKNGSIIIDNTSAFRMDDDVPLVVPEINSHTLKEHHGIIANPNCSTIQLVLALKPLQDKYGLKRVLVSTYQAVSGAGKEALDELFDQAELGLRKSSYESESKILPQPIAYNVIPHGGSFLDNGYNEEEYKVTLETRKILEISDLPISATSVRVPVTNCHSETVNVEFKQKYDLNEVKEMIHNFPGVQVMDDIKNNIYPMPINVSGQDDVFVGRIRDDLSNEMAINMFVVGDNIRKGAALNAVQVAEKMIEMDLI